MILVRWFNVYRCEKNGVRLGNVEGYIDPEEADQEAACNPSNDFIETVPFPIEVKDEFLIEREYRNTGSD